MTKSFGICEAVAAGLEGDSEVTANAYLDAGDRGLLYRDFCTGISRYLRNQISLHNVVR